MPQPILGLELSGIREALGETYPAFRARQVFSAVYHQAVTDIAEITTLPAGMRSEMAARLQVGMPDLVRRYESADGTHRYLMGLADGRTVETVLMPEERRQTICISTQAGCAVDCKFCMTALMGFERNLTAGEIAGQVLLVARDNGLLPRPAKAARGAALPGERPRLNVVMMGQGEPLLNLSNVIQATRLLAEGLEISERRMTLSTAGIIPKIAELGQEPVRPKLAISLNASTEEMRQELMPVTRKYRLPDLLEAARAYPLRPWEELTFEYVLLRGVNDSEADARRVARMLANLNAKVNLIAHNPGPGIPFETPEPARVLAFQAIVRRSLACFIRQPRGRDIFAACGQLQRQELVGQGLVTEIQPASPGEPFSRTACGGAPARPGSSPSST